MDRVGSQLGNYQLVGQLGRGGFADVYLGKHIYLQTEAALKVLRVQLEEENIEKFLKEARTIARLEHPHIVRVLEFGMEQGYIPYLVMSYAPHGSLRQSYPRGSRLPLSIVLRYGQQIAAALQYAHERGVVHRDIKPENVLLGPTDDALLSDFGLAMASPGAGEAAATEERAGTTLYMAPEQLNGRPGLASDQYALAVMVYEWLGGTPPFQGSDVEIQLQHIHGAPPPLHTYLPGIPPTLEEVIMKGLARDPRQRFPSVAAFALALEQAGKEFTAFVAYSTQSRPGLADPGEEYATQLTPGVVTPVTGSVVPVPTPLSGEEQFLAGDDEEEPPSPVQHVHTRPVSSLPGNYPTPRQAARGGRSTRARRRMAFLLLAAFCLAGLGMLGWWAFALSHVSSATLAASAATSTVAVGTTNALTPGTTQSTKPGDQHHAQPTPGLHPTSGIPPRVGTPGSTPPPTQPRATPTTPLAPLSAAIANVTPSPADPRQTAQVTVTSNATAGNVTLQAVFYTKKGAIDLTWNSASIALDANGNAIISIPLNSILTGPHNNDASAQLTISVHHPDGRQISAGPRLLNLHK